MKCPRCQQENPPQAKFCLECGTPTRAAAGDAGAYADLKDDNARLFQELQTRNHELAASLAQQAATSEVLAVIRGAQADLQSVFDAIVRNARLLCDAAYSSVYRVDGQLVHLIAHNHQSPGAAEVIRRAWPMPLNGDSFVTRAIRENAVVHADSQDDRDASAALVARAKALGHRRALVVPMVVEGEAVGAIRVSRSEATPFTGQHISLLKTFADQAVIAIENVRLFNDTNEALEQQTATAEILQVISRSPTDVQPVFNTIVTSARALTDAHACGVFLLHGDVVSIAAHDSLTDEWRQEYPRVASANTVSGRAMLQRTMVHVNDLKTNPDYEGAPGRRVGIRTVLAAPMLREGQTIGAIVVWRSEVKSFSDKEIALLQTFADQAVIAIENVRLFTELQARNAELSETLARQTATGEVLRGISRAPTDTQPVFDIIATSARRLCNAVYGQVQLCDGNLIRLAALDNIDPDSTAAIRDAHPLPINEGNLAGRVVRGGTVVRIPDLLEDPTYQYKTAWTGSGVRSLLGVPMLRDGAPIGAIAVGRSTPGLFSDKQVELLETFADQAVIAIENARLFKDLQERTAQLGRSVHELTALSQVGQALSSTLDIETVLTTIVSRAIDLSGADGGSVYEYDDAAQEFRLRATQNFEEELVDASRAMPLRRGGGALGMLAERREPVQIADISDPSAYQSPVRNVVLRTGYRALLAVPLLRDDRVIGGLVVGRKAPGVFPPGVVDLLTTFANQSALAIQNARLFRELGDKSRQLEVASQHKSEFLANMSHELRTPLNAIIGFSEVLAERMFGELNEKQDEYLSDIHASGRHLLSLINDILDLSKIEAGRMELELTDFDLPAAIDSALTLVRERATRHGIALHREIDTPLGQVRGDERKLKQVLLNLLSNAIKFTPEGGRIDVRAVLVDGMAEVAVADTGVGIAPEDQEAVFEEFRQVGASAKKVEGTGLGLALSRKFIELHGGRIWVQSQVDVGSTFTFTVPVRRVD